jgi:hypothetical protein
MTAVAVTSCPVALERSALGIQIAGRLPFDLAVEVLAGALAEVQRHRLLEHQEEAGASAHIACVVDVCVPNWRAGEVADSSSIIRNPHIE